MATYAEAQSASVRSMDESVAVVRVVVGRSRVHYASLHSFNHHDSADRVVTTCANKLPGARISDKPATCEFCVNNAARYARRDVTGELLADAIG